MSEIEQLIRAIKNGEDDKIYKLWVAILDYEDKHDDEHLRERIKSFAYSHNYEHDDVYQNAFICYIDLLEKFKISKTNGSDLEKSFLGYIHNYLFLRLHDFKKTYSIFNNKKVDSYNKFDDYEFLSDDLTHEPIGNNFIDVIQMDNYYDKLSKREKEVFNLLREGYDHGYIAKELDMDRRNVHKYKNRIANKLK